MAETSEQHDLPAHDPAGADPRQTVTRMLEAAAANDSQAAEALLPLVYEQLRNLARRHLGREGRPDTLQPTALVHEAYLRLVGTDREHEIDWNGRAHFFGAAAEAMRRILIDRARRRLAEKHGGGNRHVQLPHDVAADDRESTMLLALNEALTRFEEVDPEKASLVKLRHFAGLSQDQAADALGISRATAARHWAFARAWLYDAMKSIQRGGT